MPNNYFRFKQFTIYQDKCAMKVCTDACLFGSIISANYKLSSSSRVLDIGTGTGLLSLMYAQHNSEVIIDAIEIDEDAATQAASNFQASLWEDRLNIYHTSVQEFNLSTNHLYDLIISNPPFYENSLKSDNRQRNLALHSDELSFDELLNAVFKLLDKDGIFAVMIPYARAEEFIKLASLRCLFEKERIDVKQTVNHNFFRTILFFGKTQEENNYSTIAIRNGENLYTNEFKKLLEVYYLNL